MIYRLSKLTSGAVLTFNIARDTLVIDNPNLSAAETTVTQVLNKTALAVGGKVISLANTFLDQLTTRNVTFDDGSELKIGDNRFGIAGDPLANVLVSSRPNENKDDKFIGRAGNDRLEGGKGNDVLYGESGADFLGGGRGNDWLDGGTGDDLIFGGSENDVITTTHGARSVGDDVVYGDGGDDVINYAGAGRTTTQELYGNFGKDTITGGAGADLIHGGVDNDIVKAGAGDDKIWGDTGRDSLYGALGRDTFIFRGPFDTGVTAQTADIVRDFSSPNDSIDYLVAGTDANYIEGATTVGIGYDAAKLAAIELLQGFDGTKKYAFVTAGAHGYLFGDLNGDLAIEFSVILRGLNNLGRLDDSDII
jgi:Ca2+-binding RTX toxin-like protein